MARKRGNPAHNGKKSGSGRAQAAAQLGAMALLIGWATWLTGGFTRENLMEWVKSIGVALAIALVIRWTLGEPFKIPSGSMEPTLHGDARFFHGDRIFVNKLVYGWRWPLNHFRIPFTRIRLNYAENRIFKWHEPERWDIVVFKCVEKDGVHDTLVKRVVGMPGERIHIEGGRVYVNGEALELPPDMPDVEYTSGGYGFGTRPEDEFSLVPEECYLLLGDNSANSKDGRYWGWVPNEYILGRVSCVWLPVSRWRDFTGFSSTLWWRTTVTLLGLLLVVRLFIARSWRVRSETEDDGGADACPVNGDHLYLNRWSLGLPIPFTDRRFYRGRPPKRGEVVAYYAQNEGDEHEIVELVGRVAGLPGERILLTDDGLLVNDEPVSDAPSLEGRSFETTGPYGRSKGKKHSEVPDGHFFIVSDNPAETPDSRTLGWIPYGNLVGVASAVWWPPRRWRRIRR